MIGPTIGGLISKHFDKSTPAYIASGIFVVNAFMIAFFLPDDRNETIRTVEGEAGSGDNLLQGGSESQGKGKGGKEADGEAGGSGGKMSGAWSGIVKIVSHPGLGRITCIKVWPRHIPRSTPCPSNCVWGGLR